MLDFLSDGAPNFLDYFFWGMVSGAVGYLYYLVITKDSDPNINHVYTSNIKGCFLAVLAVILSGIMGGLFAVALDNNITTSIVSGAFVFLIYTSMLRGLKSGQFVTALKDLLIKLLTGGAK